MKNHIARYSILICLFVLPLLSSSCSQAIFHSNESESSPATDPSTEPERGGGSGTTRGNPKAPVTIQSFAVASNPFALRICLGHIKVLSQGGPRGDVSYFFMTSGYFDINSSGAQLPEINPPPGNYTKLTLYITTCNQQPSMVVTNSGGNYSTTAEFEINFFGARTEAGDGKPWLLNMQPVVDRLETVRNNSAIVPAATGASGTFD